MAMSPELVSALQSHMSLAIKDVPKSRRVPRRPKHPFNLKTRPYQIQPFFIAPTLPGETMSNLLFQARAVSDPVVSPLIGWWKEYYFFHCPFECLDGYETLQALQLDATTDVSSLQASGASVPFFTADGAMNFVKLCNDAVVAEFFRSEDEAVLEAAIDGLPLATVVPPGNEGWLESVKNDADGTDDPNLPGEQEPDPDDIFQHTSGQYQQWLLMRELELTDQDYYDWLRSHGVKVKKEEEADDFKPELVRYVRDWSYPTNTIDPSDGSPSSALSWSISERADKDRYFRRPGFLFGVTVTRPKVYLNQQAGAMVGFMDTPYDWLPAVLAMQPHSSLKKFATLTGPLDANTDAYWVDMRDLFVHGDQFFNWAITAAKGNAVNLPTAALNKRFVVEADVDALFTDAAGGAKHIYEDGIVQPTILGKQVDLS